MKIEPVYDAHRRPVPMTPITRTRIAVGKGYYNINDVARRFFVLDGDAIVYKRLISINWPKRNINCTLLLPAGTIVYLATHSYANVQKCRASEAVVLKLYNRTLRSTVNEAVSSFEASFKYEVGSYVVPDCMMSSRYRECDSGIHFFRHFSEMLKY